MSSVNGSFVPGSLVYSGVQRGWPGAFIADGSAVDNIPPTFAGVVSVNALTLTSVTLHWLAGTDNVTLQSNLIYDVRYGANPTAATTGAPLVCSTPGATSVVVPALSSATLYYFGVRCRDGAGNEDANVVTVSATTLGPDIVAPTFAGVTSIDTATLSSLKVHWSAGSDAVTSAGNLTYDVAVATSSGGCTGSNFAGAIVASSIPGATSLVVPGLTSGTTYYACVRCRDQAGNEEANNVTASLATLAPDTTPPTFAGATSLDTATLKTLTARWSAATDAVTAQGSITYDLCWATSAPACTGSNFVAMASSVRGATSTILPALTPATTYYVCVRARDAAGNEDSNNVTASGTTLGPDIAPPAFAGIVTLGSATPSSLTAGWAAATDAVTPQNAITYDVCWATSSGACTGSNFTAMASSVPGGLSLIIPGLASGTTYYACVRARDQAGNEDSNNVAVSASTTPVDATPPVVTHVSPAPGTPIQPNAAVVVDVTDDRGLTDAVLIAQFAATWEVVYDAGFSPSYRGSSATVISGGLRFTVVRVGGWPSTLTLKVRARDAAGNEA